MFIESVKNLLDAALKERPDLFLINFTVSGDNHIIVVIDGDQGVLVEDCMFVSRAIEHNLDRETIDFSLEVMSAGATSPLINKRQYKKHIGRDLKVKTTTETVEGTLIETSDKHITLQWKARETKPQGKGKITVQKEAIIAHDNIIEAKVMIKF